jgi:hypothetical protein
MQYIFKVPPTETKSCLDSLIIIYHPNYKPIVKQPEILITII